MTDLTNAQKNNEKEAQEKILNAHEFLKQFLSNFDTAKRGGIHDFMELTLCEMVSSAIEGIDEYLSDGHKTVMPQEIMSIFADSCQKVIDGIKRNLDSMDKVNFR